VSAPENPSSHALQERLGYRFRDPRLLLCALTHSSYPAENPDAGEHNQRLEFLGDSVIQLALTETLFALFPHEREGGLSQRRATLTRGQFLSNLARDLGLPEHLRVGRSEEQTGGRQRDSSLEDALEALIGAVYLDSDFDTTRRVFLKIVGPIEERLALAGPSENPKGRLQELVQAELGNGALRYVATHIAGEDHAREYEAAVWLSERLLATGRGSSKRAAEVVAAQHALEVLLLEKNSES
jgi:ribonuclease-3